MGEYKSRKAKEKKQSSDDRFKGWTEELKKFQESDLDQREQAREADRFLLDKDGQWEDAIRTQLDSQQRPRYTFDKITPVIESMMADIEDMDFGCNVKPHGGDANKDLALTLEGMIRSIQNTSKSDDIFRSSTRRLMRRGFDAWVVKAKYLDPWSFDQDLVIESIPNAINRVWTSNTCTKADSSDADVAYVLSSLSPSDYKEQYPDGTGISVDDADIDEHWDEYRPEVITIAERYYKKESMIDVAQLTNGDVVRLDEKFNKIKDEYAANGIKVERTKKVKDFIWYHCVFDGGGILEEERATIFKSSPVVTVYGNFELLGQNSKITYSGIVLKEMDAQRVHNYSKSREIEEGALAPRSKWWMTKAQAKGNEAQLARMNVSADPVQFYTFDSENPAPPYYGGGPQINPHLANLGNQMALDIKEQAGVFSAMQGQFAGRQSEDSVRMQIDRGTAATRKWVNATINGIRRVCEVLVETIPSIYDTKRQFAIVGIDGTESFVTLNDEIYDQQSQAMVKVNNLNAGKYKVICEAGPAFSNKLEAGLTALLEYAAIDPTVVQMGGDVMLRAIDAPLVDKIAERKRAQMLQAGMIPPDQMTDEEKDLMQQQAQKPREPDAEMVFAQAEMKKATVAEIELQLKAQAQEIEMKKLGLQGAKIGIDDKKSNIEGARAVSDIRNTDADTMKKVAETQKISGETISTSLDNLGKVTPQNLN